MFKYILLGTSLALILFSCGPKQQTMENYCDSLKTPKEKAKEKKWQQFSDMIGFPQRMNTVDRLKTHLTGQSTLLGENLAQHLDTLINGHWKKGLSPEDLIASNFKEIASDKQRDYTIYTISYQVKANFKPKSSKQKKIKLHTNYAYLTIPKVQRKGVPLVYFHKDDKGLSWELMKKEVGETLLKERIILAPVGSRQSLIKKYSSKKDPKKDNILYSSTHTKALAWADEVDDTVSLLRGLTVLVHETLKKRTNFLSKLSDRHSSKDNPLYFQFYTSFDFLGFSKGGLVAGLVASKIGGYINRDHLLSYKKNRGNFDDIKTEHKLVFVKKLIIVSAPTSFTHGPFQLILKAFITGDINKKSNPFHSYKKFPGARDLEPLFTAYRKVIPGSPQENKTLEKLVGEVLSRDLLFQLPYVLGGAMPQLYFDVAGEGLPQIAFLHHQEDAMMPLRAGTAPVRALAESADFSILLNKMADAEYYLYRDTYFNSSTKQSKSSFHLEEDFWNDATNKAGKTPRELIEKILDPETKKGITWEKENSGIAAK